RSDGFPATPVFPGEGGVGRPSAYARRRSSRGFGPPRSRPEETDIVPVAPSRRSDLGTVVVAEEDVEALPGAVSHLATFPHSASEPALTRDPTRGRGHIPSWRQRERSTVRRPSRAIGRLAPHP